MIIILLTIPRMMKPTILPMRRPFPPLSDVPPTMTAVMASNSYWLPDVAAATAAIRDISIVAAIPVVGVGVGLVYNALDDEAERRGLYTTHGCGATDGASGHL